MLGYGPPDRDHSTLLAEAAGTMDALQVLAVCVAVFTGQTSGQVNWGNNNWALDCDFKGQDLSSVKAKGENCGGICARMSGCTHFTWANYQGGTCWMKSGPVQRSQAIPKPGNTCGVIKETAPAPSQAPQTPSGWRPGVTTRYWDCCKPSCSWPGKANTNGVVGTCDKGGATVLSDANARSGCDGGPAFVCNDNIAWAVNSSLAYGFAAATIPGGGEAEWCCACFELKFTTTAIAGKSMVVMVTNTGSDLGTQDGRSHFDLMMPGGGVGLFDGCTPQWGLPKNNWGKTYGGIDTRKQCDGLPQPIRAGCYFRFDWFQGADNPDMNMRKVPCPKVLEQKAKCARKN